MNLIQRPTNQFAPIFDVSSISVGVPSSSDADTYFDTEVVEVQSDSAVTQYTVKPIANSTGMTIESLTPDICSISGFQINHVSEGNGIVAVKNSGAIKKLFLNFPEEGGASYFYPTGFVAGSYAEFSFDLLSELTSSTDLNIFSGAPLSSSYNPSCWVSDFDFTGVVAWNSSTNSAVKAGTAITRRHLLYAWHFRPTIGDTVRFRTADGNTIERTIIGMNTDLPGGLGTSNSNPLVADRCVAVLNSDLPLSIKVYPVVGDWFYQRTDENRGVYYAYSGIALTQNRAACAIFCPTIPSLESSFDSGIAYGQTITDSFSYVFTFRYSSSTPNMPESAFIDTFSDHYVSIGSGDSGCPVFIPISGTEMAVLTLFTTSISGYFAGEDILNASILSADDSAGVSTGYTVTVAPDPTA